MPHATFFEIKINEYLIIKINDKQPFFKPKIQTHRYRAKNLMHFQIFYRLSVLF